MARLHGARLGSILRAVVALSTLVGAAVVSIGASQIHSSSSLPEATFQATDCLADTDKWHLDIPIWPQILSGNDSFRICLRSLICPKCIGKVEILWPVPCAHTLEDHNCFNCTNGPADNTSKQFVRISMYCPGMRDTLSGEVSLSNSRSTQTVIIFRDNLNKEEHDKGISPCRPVIIMSANYNEAINLDKNRRPRPATIDFTVGNWTQHSRTRMSAKYEADKAVHGSSIDIDSGWLSRHSQHRSDVAISLDGVALSDYLAFVAGLLHGSQPVDGRIRLKVMFLDNSTSGSNTAICSPINTHIGLPFTVYPLPKVINATAISITEVSISKARYSYRDIAIGISMLLVAAAGAAALVATLRAPPDRFLIVAADRSCVRLAGRLRGCLARSGTPVGVSPGLESSTNGGDFGGTDCVGSLAVFLLTTPSALQAALGDPEPVYLRAWRLEKLTYCFIIVDDGDSGAAADQLPQWLGQREHLGFRRWERIRRDDVDGCIALIREAIARKLDDGQTDGENNGDEAALLEG